MFAYAKSEQKKASKSTVQKKETKRPVTKPNLTGIPDTMKSQFENLSRFSFDDVRVHYNSDKPAQLQALAYTQGNQVYVSPGQEQHLAHELGHLVQQKEGRVRPTIQLQGMAVNDDEALECDADTIGKAVQGTAYADDSSLRDDEPVQMMPAESKVVQRVKIKLPNDKIIETKFMTEDELWDLVNIIEDAGVTAISKEIEHAVYCGEYKGAHIDKKKEYKLDSSFGASNRKLDTNILRANLQKVGVDLAKGGEAHHIIPDNVVKDINKSSNFAPFDEDWNGIMLSGTRTKSGVESERTGGLPIFHRKDGSWGHNKYDTWIRSLIGTPKTLDDVKRVAAFARTIIENAKPPTSTSSSSSSSSPPVDISLDDLR